MVATASGKEQCSFIAFGHWLSVIHTAIPKPLTGLVIGPVVGTLQIGDDLIKFQVADLNVGVLYVLSLASLGVYGIIMAGWSSNNKYALLGSLRSSSQMISYELSMGLSLVGIIMGSKSDWSVMQHAAEALERMGIPHELEVVSAHRTPDKLFSYAETAADRGLEVIIAGAGGAAHLPGM